MSSTIRVVQGFSPNEFGTLFGAAKASADKNKLENSKLDLINGKVVTNYQFNGSLLILSFDTGVFLIISIGDDSVNWDVVSHNPQFDPRIIDNHICFEFASGNSVLWNWKEIFDAFIGKQIAVSPSDQFLFIFARGGDEYMFDVLVNKANQDERFLYISLA